MKEYFTITKRINSVGINVWRFQAQNISKVFIVERYILNICKEYYKSIKTIRMILQKSASELV